MIFNNEKISARQLYCLIVVSTVGITCLLSTDISIRYAGNKGLLCILFASVLTMLYGIIIIAICSKTEWNYKKFADLHLNSFLRNLIYILFFLKYLIMLTLTVAVMLRFLRREILKDVGTGIIFIAVILMILYSVQQNIEARGRLAECMVYFVLIPVILLAIIGICGVKIQFIFSDVSVKNMQKTLFSSLISKGISEQIAAVPAGIVYGTVILFFAFSPVEMILFMSDKITTYHDSKKIGENSKVKKAILSALTTVAAFNIIYYIIITGNLSTTLVYHNQDSLIRFAKNMKLPYLMFENQGGLFIIFFIISIYFAIFSLTYHITKLVKLIFRFGVNSQKKQKRKRACAVIFALFIFCGVNFATYHYEYFRDIRMKKENRVEIEYRKYADCMLIDYDKTKGMYQILLSFRGDGGLNKFTIYEIESLDKIKKVSAQSSNRKLDFSHVQVVIVNDKIVRDKMLRIENDKKLNDKIIDNEPENNREVYDDIIKYIEDENELSDNLNVCVTSQSVEEFAENAMELTSQPGIYISKIIENNMRNAGTKFLKLDQAQYGLPGHCELSVFNADSGKIKYEGRISLYN